MQAIIGILGGVRATIFAGLALLALLLGGVQTLRLHHSQNELAEQTSAMVVAAKEYLEWKSAVEAEKAAAIAAIDAQHREEQKRAQAAADRTIAELRDGTRKLRNRLTCPTGQSGTDAPSSGGVDGEGARGLTEEDAEFLVREAADSDRKSLKINSLIDVIEEMLRQPKESGNGN